LQPSSTSDRRLNPLLSMTAPSHIEKIYLEAWDRQKVLNVPPWVRFRAF